MSPSSLRRRVRAKRTAPAAVAASKQEEGERPPGRPALVRAARSRVAAGRALRCRRCRCESAPRPRRRAPRWWRRSRSTATAPGRRWEWVERHPADPLEVDLDPGVGVEVAHPVLAGVAVVGARREPGRHAHGDPGHPEQERHRPRELLAVAHPVLEQERRERHVAARRPLAVPVLALEVVLDRLHGVVRGLRARGELERQPVGAAVRRVAQLGVHLAAASPGKMSERRRAAAPARSRE